MSRPLLEHRIFVPRYLAGWISFTAAAGFVNAAALAAGSSVVSHVTGSVTHLATGSSVTLHLFALVLAFVGGGMLAFLASETLKKSPLLAYALPLLGACAVLVGIAVGGRAGVFGHFGAANDVTGNAFPMLALLALAMGMINASVAAATANRIRVTHMTGPATDLAGHIVRGVLSPGDAGRSELRWATLRVAKLVAFVAGAAAAAKLANHASYDIFLVAAAILFVAMGLTGTPSAVEDEELLGTQSSRRALISR